MDFMAEKKRKGKEVVKDGSKAKNVEKLLNEENVDESNMYEGPFCLKTYLKNKGCEAIVQSLTIVISAIALIIGTEYIKKNNLGTKQLFIFSIIICLMLIFLNIAAPNIYNQVLVGIGWGLGTKLFNIPTKLIANVE